MTAPIVEQLNPQQSAALLALATDIERYRGINLWSDKLRALASPAPTEGGVLPPFGDSFDGWAAWLRDRGRSFGPYVQGPMFERLAKWMESFPISSPEMKIIVPTYVNADDANRLYGEAYGVAWEYEPHGRNGMAEQVMTLHDKTMEALAATPAAKAPHCTGHTQFEYDCIDCSDALERRRSLYTSPEHVKESAESMHVEQTPAAGGTK